MKRPVFLLVLLVLVLCTSAAFAQTVSCPVGGFSVVLPDHFVEEPSSYALDPELCFYWHGTRLTVQGYASYLGEVSGADLFQVQTSYDSESELVTINRMNMLYTRTEDPSSVCISYSWMDRGNNVTLYFYYAADDPSCLNTVNRIMSSISFDAGH